MEELVSIVTPVYNAERFIEETILSVINQSYKNWELILVDDCSKDGCEKIINKYVSKDNRLRYIKLNKNSGTSVARNEGIKNANGKYLAFIDSDDIWEKDKLKFQIKFMEDNNYSFTFTNYCLIDENSQMLNKIRYVKREVGYKGLLKNNIIGCSTVILNRQNIKPIIMPCIKHEDFATWLNILKDNNIKAFGIDESFTRYRIVKGSVSNNKIKCISFTWNVYRNNQEIPIIHSIYLMLCYFYTSILKRI